MYLFLLSLLSVCHNLRIPTSYLFFSIFFPAFHFSLFLYRLFANSAAHETRECWRGELREERDRTVRFVLFIIIQVAPSVATGLTLVAKRWQWYPGSRSISLLYPRQSFLILFNIDIIVVDIIHICFSFCITVKILFATWQAYKSSYAGHQPNWPETCDVCSWVWCKCLEWLCLF